MDIILKSTKDNVSKKRRKKMLNQKPVNQFLTKATKVSLSMNMKGTQESRSGLI